MITPAMHDLVTPAGMWREAFDAMGTRVEILLPISQAQLGSATVRALFAEWERTLSRFKPDSELSRLNQRPGMPVEISPVLFQVLAAALDAAEATNGLYDPTLLSNLVHLGYDRSFERVPARMRDGTSPLPPPPSGTWRAIQIDRVHRRVTLPPGAGLDLGGIAKGMAVDAALVRLRVLGIHAALVNAGGDLAILGTPSDDTAWPISVPTRAASRTVLLRHGAMATSGIARRHWFQDSQLRHHILDPRTGLPATQGMWSVSVVATRCIQAEVAAKVAFILGPDAGAHFLQERGLAGLLVMENGEEVTAGPWPVSLERAS